ncbi:MAG: class I SAM-dependent methyltransferase [Myxococcales bacterium]|nr:class I SAM-dependent methyltransferase [Myxococcales bacterium]
MLTTYLAEAALAPDWLIRHGIRRLLTTRLRDERRQVVSGHADELLRAMARAPIALVPEKANAQHYTVPAEFYRLVLGPHLKYSGCLWEPGAAHLGEAEAAMLALTCARAELTDGQRILELGCGWGSLTLWMAQHYPAAVITAVSNSPSQRAYIEGELARRGLSNVTVITADMNDFLPAQYGPFDRVVSVEMFEHMRNWSALLARVDDALAPDGRMFIHVFAHQTYLYPFEAEGDDNWMGRHFFSGGIMPSLALIDRLKTPFEVEARWQVDGTHYQKTAEAWLANLDHNRAAVEDVFAAAGEAAPARAAQRWRMFFMACAEQFGFDGGQQWQVVHWRLRRRAAAALTAASTTTATRAQA